jgi:hypothetical protein
MQPFRILVQRPALVATSCLTLACAAGDTPTPPASAPRVVSVLVNPRSAEVEMGATVRFSAQAWDSDNRAVDSTFTWTSREAAVASVTPDGTVRGVGPGTAFIVAALQGHADSASVSVIATHDPDVLGVPRFIAADYVDRTSLLRISKFRSGFGHDYADGVEQCRSMKHYFQPRSNLDWGTLPIRSPVAGRIVELRAENTFGTQVQIVPTNFPAATVVLFHVRTANGLAVGQAVGAGETLGTHIGSQTFSDIAIRLRTANGYRLVSYFDAMTDSVFAGYAALGVPSRAALVISRAEREASPLECAGEAFLGPGALPNWFDFPSLAVEGYPKR